MKRIYRKKIKILFILVQLFCVFFAINAQDAMQVDTLRQVDAAFFEHSPEMLDSILEKNRKAYNYTDLETYSLKKIRQLVVLNELDFAKTASQIMIDNNMSNGEALALYSSTTKAIERRDYQVTLQKQQEEMLAQRKQQAQEIVIEKPKNATTYKPIMNMDTGETYFYSLGKNAYSPYIWDINIAVTDLYFADIKPNHSLKYGLGLGGEFYYYGEKVTFGGELFADFFMLTFSGEKGILSSSKLVTALAFNNLSDSIFFRTGFLYDTGFMSPVLGIAYKKTTENKFAFDVYADYNIGHFAYEDINAAFCAGASMLFPLVKNDTIMMGLKVGLSDNVYIREESIDNHIKAILSVRVGN